MAEHWYAAESATEALCPLCPVTVQRMPKGSLADGMKAHWKTCHPGLPVPRRAQPLT